MNMAKNQCLDTEGAEEALQQAQENMARLQRQLEELAKPIASSIIALSPDAVNSYLCQYQRNHCNLCHSHQSSATTAISSITATSFHSTTIVIASYSSTASLCPACTAASNLLTTTTIICVVLNR